ncbi:Schwann cell myelin protein [Echinococcus granulosus]|uniref:Schwann cell myelin protein n=1 Tax=Echinococcus granulosus TaxID=6210 RepID=W6ULJ1_ECHGR|nr:Schwann cell myelin protein [Echinococcus granulosus]EUB62405.1 Schwann cell myelin protein [Echinococcus granulosus]
MNAVQVNETTVDPNEVEVRITRFTVTLSSPLQMRSLHHQESLKVQQGEEVVLSCVVMGRPAPLISWYVNNTQQLGLWNMATGRGVIHKNKRKSRLQISNTHPMDSGNYSCLAENVNGYIKKTVEIYGKSFHDHKQRHNPGQHCHLSQFIHAIATAYTGTATSSMADRHAAVSPSIMEQDVSSTRRHQRKRKPFNLNAQLTQSPIPMNFLDPSDRRPESLSRVCTPLGHPHSHFDSLTALPWKGDTNCANVTTIVSAPTADDNPYLLTSALPLSTSTEEESRHLPQLTS